MSHILMLPYFLRGHGTSIVPYAAKKGLVKPKTITVYNE